MGEEGALGPGYPRQREAERDKTMPVKRFTSLNTEDHII
jgi:hypothetical protein